MFKPMFIVQETETGKIVLSTENEVFATDYKTTLEQNNKKKYVVRCPYYEKFPTEAEKLKIDLHK